MAKASDDDALREAAPSSSSAFTLYPAGSWVSDAVTVRPDSLAGCGVFATRDIPKGSLLAVEGPVITVAPCSDDDLDVWFCRSLHAASPESISQLQCLSMDDVSRKGVFEGPVRNTIWNWCEEHLSHNALGERRSLREMESVVDFTCRCYGIFLTNNLATGSDVGRGVFALFCRMNHSCRPSIHEHFDARTHQLSTRAVVDIRAGDEIFSSYTDIMRSRKQREKALEAWGFLCACVACSDPHDRDWRKRVIELEDLIAEFLDSLDDGPHPEGENDEGREVPTLKSASEGLGVAAELIDLLKRQQVGGAPLYNAYMDCARLGCEAKKFDVALDCARKAQEVELCCVGETGSLADTSTHTTEWIRNIEKLVAPKLDKSAVNDV